MENRLRMSEHQLWVMVQTLNELKGYIDSAMLNLTSKQHILICAVKMEQANEVMQDIMRTVGEVRNVK